MAEITREQTTNSANVIPWRTPLILFSIGFVFWLVGVILMFSGEATRVAGAIVFGIAAIPWSVLRILRLPQLLRERAAAREAQRAARNQSAASGGSVSSADAGRPPHGSSEATTEP